MFDIESEFLLKYQVLELVDDCQDRVRRYWGGFSNK